MREAELDDVKKQLQGVNDSVSSLNTNFNPIQSIRDELKGAVEAPLAGPEKPVGDATAQLAGEASPPAPVDPLIDLPPPPEPPPIDPAQDIAESLRREAEAERQAASAPETAPSPQEKSDARA